MYRIVHRGNNEFIAAVVVLDTAIELAKKHSKQQNCCAVFDMSDPYNPVCRGWSFDKHWMWAKKCKYCKGTGKNAGDWSDVACNFCYGFGVVEDTSV